MSALGVSETEWRKISDTVDEVDSIRKRYDRILKALQEMAASAGQYVADFSVEVDAGQRSAVVQSFAGRSEIRLAWRAEKDSLEGVMVVASAASDGIGAHQILQVFIPSDSGPYLMLEGGATERAPQSRAGDFAYTVLMNIVRKQVDLSTRI